MAATAQPTLNHRREHRTFSAFPVFVRATSADGRRIKISTLTDNISSGGLFMQLPYLLTHGAQLFALISVPGSAGLAAIGRVVRTENKGRGLTGIAVCFSQTRLLPLAFA
jgi:hypothetical protein